MSLSAPAALAFLSGVLLGAAWLHLLGRSVAALAGGGSVTRLVLLGLARLALAGGAMWLAATQGALPLLFALAGFAAARLALLGMFAEPLR
jgi:hypothetical protein